MRKSGIVCKICNNKKHFKSKYVKCGKVTKCLKCGCEFRIVSKNEKKEIKKIYGKNYFSSWNIHNEAEEVITRNMKYETFKRLLKILGVRKGNKILDVGCATGYLLDVARKFGLETYGIELSKWAANIAKRKHKIYCGAVQGYIKKNKKNKLRFNYITLTDVLEHIEDPFQLLKELNYLLDEKGKLLITTPNIDSLSRKIFRKFWFQYKKEHLWYFSKKGIYILAKRAGYKIIRIEGNKKNMTIKYLAKQFSAYRVPIITQILNLMNVFLPNIIKSKIIEVPFTGEWLVVLEKQKIER